MKHYKNCMTVFSWAAGKIENKKKTQKNNNPGSILVETSRG